MVGDRNLIKLVSGGGAKLFRILYMRQQFLNRTRLSQESNLCFSRTEQWWKRIGFLSRTLTACLYRDITGLRVVEFAIDQVGRQ